MCFLIRWLTCSLQLTRDVLADAVLIGRRLSPSSPWQRNNEVVQRGSPTRQSSSFGDSFISLRNEVGTLPFFIPLRTSTQPLFVYGNTFIILTSMTALARCYSNHVLQYMLQRNFQFWFFFLTTIHVYSNAPWVIYCKKVAKHFDSLYYIYNLQKGPGFKETQFFFYHRVHVFPCNLWIICWVKID